jgi:large subunit ribosomal protein L24
VAKPVTKPSKQRKMVFQAPDHIRYKLFAAPLSRELKASHGINSLPVRSGDTVRLMRGENKGFEGKITSVNRKKYRIYVEGLTREKVDGSTTFVPVHPSKVMITRLNLDDKWRKRILERKKVAPTRAEEVEVKPPKRELVMAKEEVTEAKPTEEKPKRRKRKAVKRPAAKKVKEKAEEVKKEEKPKAKKTRARRKTAGKTAEKTEEGM